MTMHRIRLLLLLCLAMSGGFPAAEAQNKAHSKDSSAPVTKQKASDAPHKSSDDIHLAFEAEALSPEAADALEQKVQMNPEDWQSRVKLLGYYLVRITKSEDACRARDRHILWSVQHHPTSDLFQSPFCDSLLMDKSCYQQCKSLWMDQIKNKKNDPIILKNAAGFLFFEDKEISMAVWQDLQSLQPDNSDWPEFLAMTYKSQSSDASQKEQSSLIHQALKSYLKALQLSDDTRHKAYLRKTIAIVALEAQEYETARLYAQQCVQWGKTHSPDLFNTKILYYGDIVLGILAVRDGKLHEAIAYLKETSIVWKRLPIGVPEFRLAKDIFDAGETHAVLDYLHTFSAFSSVYLPPICKFKIDEMATEITNGLKPDFSLFIEIY